MKVNKTGTRKDSTISSIDLKPRDLNMVALIGKSRIYRDRKRTEKLDKTGRKAKHKKRDE